MHYGPGAAWQAHRAQQVWGDGREHRPGALPLLGVKVGPRFLWVHSLLANLKPKMGVRVQEGRNGVTQMVSYPGYAGLSAR